MSMGPWRHDLDEWLASEAEQDDDRAETAFASAMRTLPPITLPSGFADSVMANWSARRKAARRLRMVQAAAIVVFGTISAVVLAAAVVDASASVVGLAGSMLVRAVVSFAALARTMIHVSSIVSRLGELSSTVFGSGTVTASLLILEVVALTALISLRRLAHMNGRHSSMEAWT
jgi:hypothetical protein